MINRLLTGVVRFIIGIILFKWSYPIFVSLGMPETLATVLIIGVLVGLGILSYKFIPF